MATMRNQTRRIAHWKGPAKGCWPTMDELKELIERQRHQDEVLEDISLRTEIGSEGCLEFVIYTVFASGGDVNAYL